MFTSSSSTASTRSFPRYGIVAVLLCLAAWICSWARIEPFYRYSFFPLWFGYIVTMDAVVMWRHGTSLLARMRWRYMQLFIISSIFWWIFEWLNVPVQNWHYILDQPYTPLAYFLIASINFSTVLPAVMETAEFLSTFEPLHPNLSASETGVRMPRPLAVALIVLGIVFLVLPWVFPHYAFALIWLGLIFVLDPFNNLVGRKSTFAHLLARDWRFIVLPLAGLWCGFFWEMWNYFALPKWYYTVPYISFFKIFEMPVLGYSGYLPFALELFAMYQFVLFWTCQKKDYLAI